MELKLTFRSFLASKEIQCLQVDGCLIPYHLLATWLWTRQLISLGHIFLLQCRKQYRPHWIVWRLRRRVGNDIMNCKAAVRYLLTASVPGWRFLSEQPGQKPRHLTALCHLPPTAERMKQGNGHVWYCRVLGLLLMEGEWFVCQTLNVALTVCRLCSI